MDSVFRGAGSEDRNRHGRGMPGEEVLQVSNRCTWASLWLMKTQAFAITSLWITGLGTYPKGKEGATWIFLVTCVPSRSCMGQ